jgi:hypothetical protein
MGSNSFYDYINYDHGGLTSLYFINEVSCVDVMFSLVFGYSRVHVRVPDYDHDHFHDHDYSWNDHDDGIIIKAYVMA